MIPRRLSDLEAKPSEAYERLAADPGTRPAEAACGGAELLGPPPRVRCRGFKARRLTRPPRRPPGLETREITAGYSGSELIRLCRPERRFPPLIPCPHLADLVRTAHRELSEPSFAHHCQSPRYNITIPSVSINLLCAARANRRWSRCEGVASVRLSSHGLDCCRRYLLVIQQSSLYDTLRRRSPDGTARVCGPASDEELWPALGAAIKPRAGGRLRFFSSSHTIKNHTQSF